MNTHPALADADYEALRRIVSREYGVDLQWVRPGILAHKLRAFCEQHGLSSLDECVRLIESTPAHVQDIADHVYSRSTRFNREPDHFAFLVDTVRRERLARPTRPAPAPDALTIWCLGCSTGQEAYTIAIYLLEEIFTGASAAANFQISAGDCSVSALQHAEAGIYPFDDVQRLAPIDYRKYFVEAGEARLSVAPHVRQHVTFRLFNLVTSDYEPARGVDVIFLRNALDFHTVESRTAVLGQVHRTLKEGGLLVLGEVSDFATGRGLDRLDWGFAPAAPGCYRAVTRSDAR
jgi:chemotaxis methyl-accepting protein methylase